MVITVITIDGFLNNVLRFLQAEKERVNERKYWGTSQLRQGHQVIL